VGLEPTTISFIC